jgi:hypothetical protein
MKEPSKPFDANKIKSAIIQKLKGKSFAEASQILNSCLEEIRIKSIVY